MEVKIGVQNANRELVLDIDQSGDDVEKAIAHAIESGLLSLDRHQGPPGRSCRRQARLRGDRLPLGRPGRLPLLTR